MDKTTFNSLLTDFVAAESGQNKVNILLQHDLKTLTNPQIEKLLSQLNEQEIKKVIQAITKKLEE